MDEGMGIRGKCLFMFAYVVLCSLNRRKIFMAPPWVSDASFRFRSGCGWGRPRSGPRASSPAAGPAHRLGWGIIAEGFGRAAAALSCLDSLSVVRLLDR